ncbi:MAG: hypothetical protein JWN22_3087 [Nocardioides sp.]|nr:hypothetical protein [Nocardioides sp.]
MVCSGILTIYLLLMLLFLRDLTDSTPDQAATHVVGVLLGAVAILVACFAGEAYRVPKPRAEPPAERSDWDEQ